MDLSEGVNIVDTERSPEEVIRFTVSFSESEAKCRGKYSLDKYNSSVFLESFESSDIQFFPYEGAGWYRLQNGFKTKIAEIDTECTRDELERIHYRGIVKYQPSDILEYGYTSIGPEDRSFGVYLEANDGKITDKIHCVIRDVLANIIDFDLEVRKVNDDSNLDYKEVLAYIKVSQNEVELRYHSTAVNTDWGASFQKEGDDWSFEGLF